ncbi:hypothetical protein OG21DRAFT_829234 [Imleria badia]|nr:hypothetical protein OG21DRAFT_829234 [Imleria badia]
MNPEIVNAETDPRGSEKHVIPIARFISEHDVCAHVLNVGQDAGQVNAPFLLNIGCCSGTDLRYLVQSGYPSDSVVRCDVRRDDFYGDRDTFQFPSSSRTSLASHPVRCSRLSRDAARRDQTKQSGGALW